MHFMNKTTIGSHGIFINFDRSMVSLRDQLKFPGQVTYRVRARIRRRFSVATW